MGTIILVTSAMENDGYAKITKYMNEGHTIAFIGSSGVGKSTLINRLMCADKLYTNGIRRDDKGRHTTTRRELILLENGALVIDTPGMRELGMWAVSEGLDKTFVDVEAYFPLCRFRDCSHTNELGCAVRAGIESGELAEERWNSYQKLKQEVAFSEDKESYLTNKEQKFKNISKANKSKRKN